MTRTPVLAALWLAAAAIPAASQEAPPAPPPPSPREMRLEMMRPPMAFMMHRRARLGVSVNLAARDTDSIGAYVNGVTPGGPAARAGIQSGDVITRLDGTSLVGGDTGARAGESAPGFRLVELAARLGPGDTVAVEYRRGRDRRTTTLVTSDDPAIHTPAPGEGPSGFSFDFDDEGPAAVRWFGGRHAPGMEGRRAERVLMRLGTPLADVELASLNPDLGRYFGTTEGVLVVSVPEHSPYGLKGGDVVLAVDGRKPSSPGHLIRILGSYDRGDTFKVEIMRDRKRQTVSVTVPAS